MWCVLLSLPDTDWLAVLLPWKQVTKVYQATSGPLEAFWIVSTPVFMVTQVTKKSCFYSTKQM